MRPLIGPKRIDFEAMYATIIRTIVVVYMARDGLSWSFLAVGRYVVMEVEMHDNHCCVSFAESAQRIRATVYVHSLN